MERKEIIRQINTELYLANKNNASFRSNHEGYAVLKEEVDELWDEIKKSKETRANRMMMNEAIQVAAMAIKFVENLC